MAKLGGANRIELESQVLSAVLRQNRSETDSPGVALACRELSYLFPDLLPSPECHGTASPPNYYELLQIDCDVNPSMVAAAKFKAIKQFLRENPDLQSKRETYYHLLDAGFILRKPRLRMSHDMVLAREVVDGISLETTDTDDASKETSDSCPLLIQLLNHVGAIGSTEAQALLNQRFRYPEIPLVELVLQGESVD